jgi:sugar transferase (PEP-CTERM system associated)
MKIRVLNQYLNLSFAVLAVVESIITLLVPIAAEIFVFGRSVGDLLADWRAMVPQTLFFMLWVLLALTAMGLYNSRQRARTLGLVLRAGVAHLLALLLVAIVAYFVPQLRPMPSHLLAWISLSLLCIMVVRAFEGLLLDEDVYKRRVLVYGAGQRARSLMQLRRRADQRGFVVVGYMPAPGEQALVDLDKVLNADPGHLLRIAKDLGVQEIVIAMDDRRREFPLRELLDCRLSGLEVVDLISFLERETGRVHLDVLHPSWIIFAEGFRRDGVRLTTKRVFDIVASMALVLITWPVILFTMLAIKIEEGLRAPVLYRQRRVGLDGHDFDVLKFRSMRVDAEGDGKARWATGTDDRVTRVGRFIRKVRIDELPQIFNVLCGHMSFVGPRPERPEFVAQLSESIPYYVERHCAKPGITGWAQICYPYGSSEKDSLEKLQYDLYYVKNHSLLFDMMILLQTVEVVLLGKGGR